MFLQEKPVELWTVFSEIREPCSSLQPHIRITNSRNVRSLYAKWTRSNNSLYSPENATTMDSFTGFVRPHQVEIEASQADDHQDKTLLNGWHPREISRRAGTPQFFSEAAGVSILKCSFEELKLSLCFWILFLHSRNLPSKILKRFYKTISPLPKLGAGTVFTLCLLSSVNLKIIKLLLLVQKKMSNCASWIISTIEFQKHLPCKVHCFHAIKDQHCHFSMWNHWSWRNCRMRTPNV